MSYSPALRVEALIIISVNRTSFIFSARYYLAIDTTEH